MSAIELYEKLFYVFAGMGALSLALSIFLFIRFDIPKTYAVLTGKTRRKTIQEIESRNYQTGRLRQNSKGSSGSLSEQKARRRKSGGRNRSSQKGRSSAKRRQDDIRRRERRPRPTIAGSNSDPRSATVERPETSVLSIPAMDTVILPKSTGLTEELARTEMLKSGQDVNFYFRIMENTICIHTNELI